jgi:hypothetical protein
VRGIKLRKLRVANVSTPLLGKAGISGGDLIVSTTGLGVICLVGLPDPVEVTI